MIKSIEIIDFECHKHSLLDGLDSGLNLICGAGDSGKTSCIRAIKLVALNHFDPKSVRVGAKNCVVKITTDKGWVKVTRGEDNLWETCKNGEPVKHFTKIGKNILPEAAEIIGLQMVKLGGLELPVNIMDQTEAHFLLNQIGGNDSSGSLRAQVVDEISGLAGIEELIRAVSLDGSRLLRHIKELNELSLSTRAKQHNYDELISERDCLDRVDQLLVELEKNKNAVSVLQAAKNDYETVLGSIDALERQIAGLPDCDTAKAIIERLDETLRRYVEIKKLADSITTLENAISEKQKSASNSIDIDVSKFGAIQELIEKKKALDSLYKSISELGRGIESQEKALAEVDILLAAANGFVTGIMSEIKICPLTLGPIKCKELL